MAERIKIYQWYINLHEELKNKAIDLEGQYWGYLNHSKTGPYISQ